MMTNYELAKWSLSPEEWDMLMRYVQYYREVYGNEQIPQERAGESVNRGLEDVTSYNPFPQIE